MWSLHHALRFVSGHKHISYIIRHRNVVIFQSKLCQTNYLNSQVVFKTDYIHSKLPELDEEFKKKIYNTKLWAVDPTVSFVKRRTLANKILKQKEREALNEVPSKSICVKLLDETESASVEVTNQVVEKVDEEIVSYPYNLMKQTNSDVRHEQPVRKRRGMRRQAEEAAQLRADAVKSWLSDYEFYDEKQNDNHNPSDTLPLQINYGTADRSVPVSNVPCGGCGAFLHCQGPSIPGYLPKELIFSRTKKELQSLICQRCHFLKEYNVALGVNVSPQEYPKILSQIKEKRGVIVLLVDLLDFPCSIWPEFMDIIGTKRPVVIVGNKIDLIPGDHSKYLEHISMALQTSVEYMGVEKANIKFTALISAQTGFGVEDLITRLHELWEYKSDVYLVGCTNVGKSTLFNTLIQSDFCKVKAVDLVQRATTSVWPGTTLNLLKFPILRPEGWRLTERQERLNSTNRVLKLEKKLLKEQLKRHRLYHMPSLYQFVGRSFFPAIPEQNEKNLFCIETRKPKAKDAFVKVGIDEDDPEFAKGRWCYDTPGVVNPSQILDILTTEELMKVLPRKTIVPRFFTLKPGKSIFLAGLGRLDYLSSTDGYSARFTVFSSKDLPITISAIEDAEHVYDKLLGSLLMAVPCGGPKRLSQWPGLKPNKENLKVVGINYMTSCADVVLSSAGWISVTAGERQEITLKVWTPLARGIYLRQPSLLPYAVNFKGKRIDHTPTYEAGRSDGALFTGTHLCGKNIRDSY